MPRRTGPVCKMAGNESRLRTDVEWSFLHGPQASSIGCRTIEEYRRAWVLHGDSMLKRYIKCVPGSRPWPVYLLGILPPPPRCEEPRISPVRIGDNVWFDASSYGMRDENELDHLIAIGEVKRTEERLAVDRLWDHGISLLSTYDWISEPGDF